MDGIFLVHREHYRPRILTLLTPEIYFQG